MNFTKWIKFIIVQVLLLSFRFFSAVQKIPCYKAQNLNFYTFVYLCTHEHS
jgi:hypothetical protein